MHTKIVQTGNSRAVIIPAALANQLDWNPGDVVDATLMATGLTITPPATARSIRSVARRIMRERDEVFRELASR
jgi:antitoxin component of MazEF toxin-antitoxin module